MDSSKREVALNGKEDRHRHRQRQRQGHVHKYTQRDAHQHARRHAHRHAHRHPRYLDPRLLTTFSARYCAYLKFSWESDTCDLEHLRRCSLHSRMHSSRHAFWCILDASQHEVPSSKSAKPRSKSMKRASKENRQRRVARGGEQQFILY